MARLVWLSLLLLAAMPAPAVAAEAPVPAVKTFPYKPVGTTILVPVSVAGRPARWFILDTGANSCVLDQSFAQEIGVKPLGEGAGSGAGRGPVPYDKFAADIDFAIAGEKFPCPHAIGIDLSGQPAIIGEAIAGIMGSDLFEHFIVETDYELQIVRLHDKARFTYSGSGTRIPFTFDRRRPVIIASLNADGKRADRPLLVDSGSQGAVDDAWIAQGKGLRAADGGVGLGQSYRTSFGRLSEVQIGPFKFTDVPGVSEGVPLVGGEVLQRFNIIYDWPRQQLILEPHPFLSGSLSQWSASGLSFRRGEDGAVRIEDVGAGTPAARAGLRKGDVIAAVDGTAASEFGFQRMIRLFRLSRAYRLSILRDGAARSIDLVM